MLDRKSLDSRIESASKDDRVFFEKLSELYDGDGNMFPQFAERMGTDFNTMPEYAIKAMETVIATLDETAEGMDKSVRETIELIGKSFVIDRIRAVVKTFEERFGDKGLPELCPCPDCVAERNTEEEYDKLLA